MTRVSDKFPPHLLSHIVDMSAAASGISTSGCLFDDEFVEDSVGTGNRDAFRRITLANGGWGGGSGRGGCCCRGGGCRRRGYRRGVDGDVFNLAVITF